MNTVRQQPIQDGGRDGAAPNPQVRPVERPMTVTAYQCRACSHPFYEHRESSEWQLINPRRKRDLTGCTRPGCDCEHADESHVTGTPAGRRGEPVSRGGRDGVTPGPQVRPAERPMSAPIATVTRNEIGTWDVRWAAGGVGLGYPSLEAARKMILNNLWNFNVEVIE